MAGIKIRVGQGEEKISQENLIGKKGLQLEKRALA